MTIGSLRIFGRQHTGICTGGGCDGLFAKDFVATVEFRGAIPVLLTHATLIAHIARASSCPIGSNVLHVPSLRALVRWRLDAFAGPPFADDGARAQIIRLGRARGTDRGEIINSLCSCHHVPFIVYHIIANLYC